MLYCDCSRTTRLCRRNKLVGEWYGQQKTQRNRHNRHSGNRVNRVERRRVLVRHAERRVGRISTRRVAIRDARTNERSGATAVGTNGFCSDNRIRSNSQPKLHLKVRESEAVGFEPTHATKTSSFFILPPQRKRPHRAVFFSISARNAHFLFAPLLPSARFHSAAILSSVFALRFLRKKSDNSFAHSSCRCPPLTSTS